LPSELVKRIQKVVEKSRKAYPSGRFHDEEDFVVFAVEELLKKCESA